jgi:hypothetical protein
MLRKAIKRFLGFSPILVSERAVKKQIKRPIKAEIKDRKQLFRIAARYMAWVKTFL